MIHKISYKDVPIRFEDGGEGTPVVLLHGYLEALEIWEGIACPLSEKFRVITIDLPGHGETGISGGVSSMEFMAVTVKEVLDHLDIGKCILIGHSMGGYATLAFLELFPERLSGFSLFHSKPQPDPPEAIENRKRSINLIHQKKKELLINSQVPRGFADRNLDIMVSEVEHALKIAQKTSDEGIIAALKGMMERPSREKLLSETNLPFLYILGKHDNYLPFNIIYSSTVMPKNGNYLILENSGHMGFIEEKENSLIGVEEFVKNIVLNKT